MIAPDLPAASRMLRLTAARIDQLRARCVAGERVTDGDLDLLATLVECARGVLGEQDEAKGAAA